ncbi:MAG: hypothetical protein SFV32_09055 [Opitutaceae bacterium]|nr:hypothetical protein [Opitutaceae bacterium]
MKIRHSSLAFAGSTLAGALLAWWVSRGTLGLVPTTPFRAQFGFCLGGCLIGAVAGFRLEGRTTRPSEVASEWLRWLCILAAGLFATLPLRAGGQVGSGDAYWYTVMIADFLQQAREGTFPVWVGQSEFAFNGGIFPLRIAPALQHLCGLIDCMTGRSLSPLQVTKLVLHCTLLAQGLILYACLIRLMGGRSRTACALLAVLAILSPALISPLYLGDQYMQTLAMTVAPVVMLSWMRWIEGPKGDDQWVWGLSLAAAWWAHAPLAAWLTGLSFLVFAAGAAARRNPANLGVSAARVGLPALLGLYPIISISAIDNRVRISPPPLAFMEQIEIYAPHSFRILEATNVQNGAYQLGFSLLLLGVGALVYLLLRGRWQERLLCAIAVGLACSIYPVPVITPTFWRVMPEAFRSLTNIWPYQRVVPLLAVLAVVLCALLVRRLVSPKAPLVVALALPFVAWSGQQAHQILLASTRTLVPATSAEAQLHKDQAILTRYSYSAFERTPRYFSHGYMDPVLENRLLRPDTEEVLISNVEAAAPRIDGQAPPSLVERGALKVAAGDNRGFAFFPGPVLKRGEHYAMRLDLPTGVIGDLVVKRTSTTLDYPLPDSGMGTQSGFPPAAFGSTLTSSRVLPFRANKGADEELIFSLFFAVPLKLEELPYELHRVEVDSLPVRVRSLVPYRAAVSTREPALLETPRVWQSAWKATVNGEPREVRKSQQGLVAIPLSAGDSVVELNYRPSALVQVAYWSSLCGWALAGVWVASKLLRSQAPGTPA